MGMLEDRGLYDPYDGRHQALENKAGEMWRMCYNLRWWRGHLRLIYEDKGSSSVLWFMIAGGLCTIEIVALAPVLNPLSRSSPKTCLALVLFLCLATYSICMYRVHYKNRKARMQRDADPIWQRSQLLIDSLKAYSELVTYHNAYFVLHPEDTDKLDRVSAFLARPQAVLIREVKRFNAFMSMMESKRSLESSPGERVALAELTAAPDQTAALAVEYSVPDTDEVLLTDQELLEVQQELNEALYGAVPPIALPGTRT